NDDAMEETVDSRSAHVEPDDGWQDDLSRNRCPTGAPKSKQREKRQGGCLCSASVSLHARRQSKHDGLSRHKRRLPARTRVPSIYSTSRRVSIDCCACRDRERASA